MSGSDAAEEKLRADARDVFLAAVAAAEPGAAVERSLEISPSTSRPLVAGQELDAGGTLAVVALGKAACAMADTARARLDPSVFPGPGIAVTNRGNERDLDRFTVHVSGHPIPDRAGVDAAAEVERLARALGPADGLLVLVSGGGSALLPAPADGLTLEDKVRTTELLLECGAAIDELNCVRKHLSRLKGGGLARAARPARVEALLLSDVLGDDPSTIASGPTAPDPTTFGDAIRILAARGILERVPRAIREHLESGARGERPETPKPGDPLFEGVRSRVIGSNTQSVDAAVRRAEELGYATLVASRSLDGEAREAAVRLARHARTRRAGTPPLAIIAGGETTVTLRGDGAGGRNQEMALAFLLAMDEIAPAASWAFLSGGTDGRDGPTDAAGGLVSLRSLARAQAAGADLRSALDRNDSYHALAAAESLLMTGATGTNVADIQVLLLAD